MSSIRAAPRIRAIDSCYQPAQSIHGADSRHRFTPWMRAADPRHGFVLPVNNIDSQHRFSPPHFIVYSHHRLTSLIHASNKKERLARIHSSMIDAFDPNHFDDSTHASNAHEKAHTLPRTVVARLRTNAPKS